MVLLWFLCGLTVVVYMVFTWFYMVVYIVFLCGFTVVFAWFYCGFCMVFYMVITSLYSFDPVLSHSAQALLCLLHHAIDLALRQATLLLRPGEQRWIGLKKPWDLPSGIVSGV